MKQKLLKYWKQSYEDWNVIFREELRNIFRDSGVLIFLSLIHI